MGVEILDNGTRVLTAPGATFGTDALLLASFVRGGRRARCADLGTGCGVIPLLLLILTLVLNIIAKRIAAKWKI